MRIFIYKIDMVDSPRGWIQTPLTPLAPLGRPAAPGAPSHGVS